MTSPDDKNNSSTNDVVVVMPEKQDIPHNREDVIEKHIVDKEPKDKPTLQNILEKLESKKKSSVVSVDLKEHAIKPVTVATKDEISIQSETIPILYPDDLNPFGSEDEGSEHKNPEYPDDLNPFEDSDSEICKTTSTNTKSHNESSKPRAVSYDNDLNPFGLPDDDGDSVSDLSLASCTASPSRSSHTKKRQAPKPPAEGILSNQSLTVPASGRQTCSPLSVKKVAPRTPSPCPRKPESKAVKEQNNLSMAQRQAEKTPSPLANTFGYWKKKKRPAPSVPVPPRREVMKIPVKEIQSELSEIEEKQQELESQGRELEMMIRDQNQEPNAERETNAEEEDLILQLFELVNQKNVLFRRQAELMYIKRSQRLEEEQADLEFQIRCLMCKPEKQKTEEDTKKEETLLQKLLEVVELRNEIVESMDLDRQRVQDEDLSIQEQFSHRRSSTHSQSHENVSSDDTKKKKKNTLKQKLKKDKEKHKEKSKDSSDSLWKFHKKDKKKA